MRFIVIVIISLAFLIVYVFQTESGRYQSMQVNPLCISRLVYQGQVRPEKAGDTVTNTPLVPLWISDESIT